MDQINYFKPWITDSKWGVRISLFILLLFALFQFGSFALAQNFVIGTFGLQPEDVTFAMQIAYVAIVPFISINFKLAQYFQMRTYMLTGIIFCLLISYLSMHTHDFVLFCILRFFNGLAMIMVSGGVLIMIFSRLEKAKTQIVGLSVLFGTVLGNGIVIGLIASKLTSFTDWRAIYNYLMVTMILALIIVVLILRKKSGHIPLPLAKIDKLGCFFLSMLTGAIAYVFIYGPRQEWFADRSILYMSIFGFTMFLLFITRQKLSSSPLMDLKVFSSSRLLIGLLLLAFYYGLKDSINLIYAYAGNILAWDPEKIIVLGLFNIAAVGLSMWISARLLISKVFSFQAFLLTGFSLLMTYHIYLYYRLSPDLNLINLIFPIVIQGAASGMLFVPIILFSLSEVPLDSVITGIMAGAFTRFITSLTTIATFYSFQLYFSRHFRSDFRAHLIPESNQYRDFLANMTQELTRRGIPMEQVNALITTNISRRLIIQEQLLGYRYIFLVFSIISAAILLAIITFLVFRAVKANKRN